MKDKKRLHKIWTFIFGLDYSRIDMRGAAGEASTKPTHHFSNYTANPAMGQF